MQLRQACVPILLILSVSFAGTFALGDLENTPFPVDMNDDPILYNSVPANDPVSKLNARLDAGSVQLKFDAKQGYLRSVLDALQVPVESQMVVFSKTGLQMERTSPANPRSLFFNDSVVVGWVRNGLFVELAAEDPSQGMIFYTLDARQVDQPRFIRHNDCLQCHLSYSTLGVPGALVLSVATDVDGNRVRRLGEYVTDDRSPFAERWGGWYVTGFTGQIKHMGNALVSTSGKPMLHGGEDLNVRSLEGRFDTSAYATPYSDVVALMVFEHEMHMMNLFTRLGWEARLASYHEQTGKTDHAATARIIAAAAREVVDYMLFADEAPLTSSIAGNSGFAEQFAAEGPKDSQGRSLRQLDLQHRLMRYPCSYMIYSDAFENLPEEAKAGIYTRLWEVLSGEDHGAKYAKLALGDRKAIVEILRETKSSLPEYFREVSR